MKKKTKKRYLNKQDFQSKTDAWTHVLSFLYENRKRICGAGLDDEAAFQLGGEVLVIKGK